MKPYDGEIVTKPDQNVAGIVNQSAETGIGVSGQYNFLMPELITVLNKSKKIGMNLHIALVGKDPEPLTQLDEILADIQKIIVEKNPNGKYTILVVSPIHNMAVSNEYPQFHIEDAADNLNYKTPVTRVESYIDNLNRPQTNWNDISIILVLVLLITTSLSFFRLKKKYK